MRLIVEMLYYFIPACWWMVLFGFGAANDMNCRLETETKVGLLAVTCILGVQLLAVLVLRLVFVEESEKNDRVTSLIFGSIAGFFYLCSWPCLGLVWMNC
jgi:hypothetical protein